MIIEHATLTNECGVMWGGTVVKGIPSSGQFLNTSTDFANQGFVRLKPGAVIENAITGINASFIDYPTTGNNTWYPTYVGGHGGGLVKALGTSSTNRNVIFRNCANAVNFYDYNKNNNSSFENCLFIANAYLNNEHYVDYQDPAGPARKGMLTFVNNWAVGDLKFTNCTFKTDLSSPSTFNPRRDLRGRAYMSSDGGAIFDGCTFENVNRGLMCNNVYSFRKPVAKNCTFNSVWRAASFRSLNNPEFMNNTINMGDQCQFAQFDMNSDITDIFSLQPFGIYYSAASGFKIRYNTINKPTSSSSIYQFGVVMNNTWNGTHLNQHSLYRNTINNVTFGVDMFQDAQGVQIKCNDLNVSGIGILASPSSTILGKVSDQGNCLPVNTNGEYKAPAGNKFNQAGISGTPCSTGVHIASWYGNLANDFRYNQHSNSPYQSLCPSTGSTFPYINMTQVPNNCVQTCATFNDCCPVLNSDNNNPWDDYPDEDAISTMHSAIEDLEAPIIAGNAAELLEAIADENITSSELKTTLLSADTYLSDAVLIAAINRTSFEYDDLRDVLVANAFLRYPVLEALEERGDGMIDDQYIIDAQTVFSPRAAQEGAIRELYLQRNELIERAASYYIAHEHYDSAAALYNTYGGYEQAIALYLMTDQPELAEDAAEQITDEQIRTLALLYVSRALDDRRYADFNDTELATISEIAESPYTIAGERARMWLWQIRDSSSIELMPEISEAENTIAQQQNFDTDKPAKKQQLKVYPNPATNEVNISVSSGLLGAGTVISAYDVTGRRMVRIVPDENRQKATINTTEWSSGIYVISVQRSNGDITTTKVTVVK